jgi:hypothetical protein
MKPLELKEPAPCCGSPTLLWIPQKQHYVCPCGQMKAGMNGKLKTRRNFMEFDCRKKPRS